MDDRRRYPHTLRRALPIVAAAALLLTAVACGGPVAAAEEIKAKLPGGRTLRFHCIGTGSPTIILEGAYGSGWKSWSKVQPELARRTRTCGYARAGVPPSDAGPLPRDANAIVRDLNAGLRSARIPGPYVLVGHSIGGLFARAFYDRHPDRVAGMVLVDPSVEHQADRFAAAFPGAPRVSITPMLNAARTCVETARARLADGTTAIPSDCGSDPRRVIGMWSNMGSELENLDGATTAEIDRGRKSYGRLPLIVLTAGDMYAGPAAPVWQALHRGIAERSQRGQARVVAGSGHNMPKDKPDAIVAAVDDVLAMTRQR